jgi:hypothetical protein
MKKKESNYQTKNLKSGHGPHKGPDTKTKWPTDRRSQYEYNWKSTFESFLQKAWTEERAIPSNASHINQTPIYEISKKVKLSP